MQSSDSRAVDAARSFSKYVEFITVIMPDNPDNNTAAKCLTAKGESVNDRQRYKVLQYNSL